MTTRSESGRGPPPGLTLSIATDSHEGIDGDISLASTLPSPTLSRAPASAHTLFPRYPSPYEQGQGQAKRSASVGLGLSRSSEGHHYPSSEASDSVTPTRARPGTGNTEHGYNDVEAVDADEHDYETLGPPPVPPTLRRSSSHSKASPKLSSNGFNAGIVTGTGGGIGNGSGRGTNKSRRNTLMRANDLPTTVLSSETLARLREWIECVAIVNFDLEHGPDFDNCYPPVHFSAHERAAIAFSSFPDHNEKGESTLAFSWRIPRLAPPRPKPSTKPARNGIDALTSTTHLCGYCYFQQEQNKKIRRGYAQRSLVLITSHDHAHLAGLFSRLVNILGPMYFRSQYGESATVETAIHNICRWPSPSPGSVLEIAFLGHIMTAEIPLPNQAQYSLSTITKSSTSQQPPSRSVGGAYSVQSTSNRPLDQAAPLSPASIPILTSHPLTPLTELLRASVVDQIWLIWELVVLAEPILVYASDPGTASEFVNWLITIIRPVPFAGDYRPFFHIHTPDFASLLNNSEPRRGLLLGATNPLILSGARRFPHIIRLGPPPPPPPTLKPSLYANGANLSASQLNAPSRKGSASSTSSSLSTAGSSSSLASVGNVFASLSKSKVGSQSFRDACSSTNAHGIFSERKRTVNKDRTVLKLVLERIKAGDYEAADALLIQCMSLLTERFLVPLNRYFATLLPPDTTSGMSIPRPTQTFNKANFLQSLKTHGHPLTFRSKMPTMHMPSSQSPASVSNSAVAFYEKFLDSPNFQSWLEDRSETTQATARSRYLNRLENGNPELYLQGKNEEEMSDLMNRLESEARITDEELSQTLEHPETSLLQPPSGQAQQQAGAVDTIHHRSPSPSSLKGHELQMRSARLKSQLQRVRAIKEAALASASNDAASSEESDASDAL